MHDMGIIKKEQPEKVNYNFVSFLRGVSALFVLLSHLWLVFWSDGSKINAVWEWLDTTEIPSGILAQGMQALLGKMNLNAGAVGVAFFFLISGFLVRNSMQKYQKPGRFLLAKALRVFPVYIVGFSVTFGMIYLYVAKNHLSFPYTFWDWLTQVLLIRHITWLPSIDQISWTLFADVEFWCLIALLMSLSRTTTKDLIIAGGCLTCISVVCSVLMQTTLENEFHTLYHIEAYVTLGAFCLTFMLMGTVMFDIFSGAVNRYQSAGALFGIYLCFIICCFSYSGDKLDNIFSYTFSGIVFYLCMFLSRAGHCQRLFQNKLVIGISIISFPLYILHALNGYLIETALSHAGITSLTAFCAAVLFSMLAACLVHYFCEKPMLQAVKRVVGHHEKTKRNRTI